MADVRQHETVGRGDAGTRLVVGARGGPWVELAVEGEDGTSVTSIVARATGVLDPQRGAGLDDGVPVAEPAAQHRERCRAHLSKWSSVAPARSWLQRRVHARRSIRLVSRAWARS